MTTMSSTIDARSPSLRKRHALCLLAAAALVGCAQPTPLPEPSVAIEGGHTVTD